MRLIDGDKLEQRLLDEAARIMADDLYGKDRQRMVRGLQKAAEICRAADSVKHGRWKWDGEDYYCSECTKHAYGSIAEVLEGEYKFCPFCGARMDGDDHETD